MVRLLKLFSLASVLALFAGAVLSHATLLGPTPSLSVADSPWASTSFSCFHLEDFEDGPLFSLIILVIDIFAIYKILTSSAETVKKIIRVPVVILLPLIGAILWWFMGPKQNKVSCSKKRRFLGAAVFGSLPFQTCSISIS